MQNATAPATEKQLAFIESLVKQVSELNGVDTSTPEALLAQCNEWAYLAQQETRYRGDYKGGYAGTKNDYYSKLNKYGASRMIEELKSARFILKMEARNN